MTDLPIGSAIKRVRLARGMSRTQVESRCGMSRDYMYKVESGHTVPGLVTLVRLADALDLAPDRLLRVACRMRSASERASAKVVA